MNCRRVALSLVVIGLGLSGCTAQSAHTSPSTAPSAGRAGTSSTSSSGVPPTSTPSPSTARASFDLGYPPLFPFGTLGEAQSWQLAHRVGGQQPWHLDAGATALAFASGWLGFRELDTVTSTTSFANSFETGRTFVFDLSDQVHPHLSADFGDAGPFTHPHSFARTPSGTVLATYQGLAADHAATGGLVELDDRGRMIRGASAANPLDPDLRPYSLTVVPQLDRVVTTSADMHGVRVGAVGPGLAPFGPGPPAHGDAATRTARRRAPASRRSATPRRWKVRDDHDLSLRAVPALRTRRHSCRHTSRSFPWSPVAGEDTDCNVPVRSGRFWIQPVGTTGSLVVLDVSRPEKPVVVDELAFGIDARPHWLALEPGGRRIVMTGGGTLAGGRLSDRHGSGDRKAPTRGRPSSYRVRSSRNPI